MFPHRGGSMKNMEAVVKLEVNGGQIAQRNNVDPRQKQKLISCQCALCSSTTSRIPKWLPRRNKARSAEILPLPPLPLWARAHSLKPLDEMVLQLLYALIYIVRILPLPNLHISLSHTHTHSYLYHTYISLPQT